MSREATRLLVSQKGLEAHFLFEGNIDYSVVQKRGWRIDSRRHNVFEIVFNNFRGHLVTAITELDYLISMSAGVQI